MSLMFNILSNMDVWELPLSYSPIANLLQNTKHHPLCWLNTLQEILLMDCIEQSSLGAKQRLNLN